MKVDILDTPTAQKLLLDTGVLFVINKLVLHPLGLALSFVVDDADTAVRMELVRTKDRQPWDFHPGLAEEARGKLRKFLADQRHPPINGHIFDLVLSEEDTSTPDGYYKPKVRHYSMGSSITPAILKRDPGTVYNTYTTYTRKDLAAAFSGAEDKRPGLLLVLLERAWEADHGTPAPNVVMLPRWFFDVWKIMAAEFGEDARFVGKMFHWHEDGDRIYLANVT